MRLGVGEKFCGVGFWIGFVGFVGCVGGNGEGGGEGGGGGGEKEEKKKKETAILPLSLGSAISQTHSFIHPSPSPSPPSSSQHRGSSNPPAQFTHTHI